MVLIAYDQMECHPNENMVPEFYVYKNRTLYTNVYFKSCCHSLFMKTYRLVKRWIPFCSFEIVPLRGMLLNACAIQQQNFLNEIRKFLKPNLDYRQELHSAAKTNRCNLRKLYRAGPIVL